MKKNLIFIISVLFLSSYTTFLIAGPCNEKSGPSEPCDPCKEYPYRICKVDAKGNAITETVCTNDPNSLHNIVRVPKLPIKLSTASIVGPHNGPHGYGIGSSVGGRSIQGLVSDFDHNKDYQEAANKWNCICGYYWDGNYDADGTTISVAFSDNYYDFDDPYSSTSAFHNRDKGICDPTGGMLLFNATREFRNALPSDNNPDKKIPPGAVSNFIMDNSLMDMEVTSAVDYSKSDNYSNVIKILDEFSILGYFDKTKNYKIYNLMDVAIQAIGNVLGMGYSDKCGCDTSSIMHPNGVKPVNDPAEGTIYDTLWVDGYFTGKLLAGGYDFEITDPDGRYLGSVYGSEGASWGIKEGNEVTGHIKEGSYYHKTGEFLRSSLITGTYSGTKQTDSTLSGIILLMVLIDRDPDRIYEPKPYSALGGVDNAPSGDCDKCMFAKLYCHDDKCTDNIYEEQSSTEKLYPNPASKTTSIDFTLPNSTNNLKISIMNNSGQVLLVVKENGTYSAGEHTELINIESLPQGTYYVIIETGTNRITKPFIVTD